MTSFAQVTLLVRGHLASSLSTKPHVRWGLALIRVLSHGHGSGSVLESRKPGISAPLPVSLGFVCQGAASPGCTSCESKLHVGGLVCSCSVTFSGEPPGSPSTPPLLKCVCFSSGLQLLKFHEWSWTGSRPLGLWRPTQVFLQWQKAGALWTINEDDGALMSLRKTLNRLFA